jgi:biopolymer transport protein ExbD
MTPMVDLGFLLIAFFIVTTEMTEPRAAKLNLPHDGPPTKLEMSNALTVLLDKDNTIYYYHGDWKEAKDAGQVLKTSFFRQNGLGDVIRAKQKLLDNMIVSGEGRDGLMLLIKPSAGADYGNVVDVLDEILINDVRKYGLVNPSPEEINYLADQ